MPDIELWEEAQAILDGALGMLVGLAPKLQGTSADTTFACGEAAGLISKARALLGRDIDVAYAARAVAARTERN